MSDTDQKTSPAAGQRALTPAEKKQRDRRNLAIAAGLVVFIILVFAVTVLRLAGAVAERSF